MAQSATFYRISKESFDQLNKSVGLLGFLESASSKDYVVLQGSFKGLEFVLAKSPYPKSKDLARDIFHPSSFLENAKEIKSLNRLLSAKEGLMGSRNNSFSGHTDAPAILRIHQFLGSLSAIDINEMFDADELNQNGIYPNIWHTNNAPGYAYNAVHLADDFQRLRSFFSRAAETNDIILVFEGNTFN